MQYATQSLSRKVLAGVLLVCLLSGCQAGVCAVAEDTEVADARLCEAWQALDDDIALGVSKKDMDARFLSTLSALNIEYPGHAGILYSLGVAFGRTGMHDSAIVCYTAAIELDVFFISAYGDRAYSYSQLEQNEAARDGYGAAADLLLMVGRQKYDVLLDPYIGPLLPEDEDGWELWWRMMHAKALHSEVLEDYEVAMASYRAIGEYDEAARMQEAILRRDAQAMAPEATLSAYEAYLKEMIALYKAEATAQSGDMATLAPAPTPAPVVQLPANYLTVRLDGQETLWWLTGVSYKSHNDDKGYTFKRFDENGYCTGVIDISVPKATATEVFDSLKPDERGIYLQYKDIGTGITYAAYDFVGWPAKPAGAAFNVAFVCNSTVFTGTFAATMISERPVGGVVFSGGEFYVDEGYGAYPVPTENPNAVAGEAGVVAQTADAGGFVVGTPKPVQQVWVDCSLCNGNKKTKCGSCGGDGWIEWKYVGTDKQGKRVYESVRCERIGCVSGSIACDRCKGQGGRYEWK